MTPLDYTQIFFRLCPVITGNLPRFGINKPYPIALHVEVKDLWGGTSLRVGHFGHNVCTGTGNVRPYESEEALMADVERAVKRRFGTPVIQWITEEKARTGTYG
jgi:hypothetical protein